MITIPSATRLGIAFGLTLSLAACGSIFPEEGPSIFAGRSVPSAGPSAQRLGPDGYPLLGAFPNSAAPQLTDPDLAGQRSGLQSDSASQRSTAVAAAGQYERTVAELRAARAEQAALLREADARAAEPAADEAEMSSEDILREIEGR